MRLKLFMVFIMFIRRSSQKYYFSKLVQAAFNFQLQDELEHQEKADHIVKVVLERLDLDGDGRVSAEELVKVGLDGLPNFEGLGADGHHYDVESGESNLF